MAFKENQVNYERNVDHKDALRAEKVGKKIARRAVRMSEAGVVESNIQTTFIGLTNESADTTSVTLAANAELNAKKTAIRVKYSRQYDSLGDDYDATVRITEADGEKVR